MIKKRKEITVKVLAVAVAQDLDLDQIIKKIIKKKRISLLQILKVSQGQSLKKKIIINRKKVNQNLKKNKK